MSDRPLTPKQQAFIREYLLDLNATQAARRAGYSAHTADRIGPELLGKTCVARAIAQAQAARADKLEITAAWVLEKLKANYETAVTAGELGVVNKSLELIGKHLGMFTDKQQHTGNLIVKVVYDDEEQYAQSASR